ncbi:MAG: hypothetical protein CR993_07715 [Rhodobacterales bacterium]|nr:MAG: hypothetical protein CR993_07715 [Rhodobacterales bacterium]
MDWVGWADWAWARHHNEWSWYIRPLILIAFCMAAWHRKLFLTVLLALFFPISAVVFPAPQVPKDFVIEFLSAERELLASMSALQLWGFVALVVAFLTALATAFWRRSLLWGLVVANLGGAIKLLFSLLAWGDTGQTALLPTLVTALVFNTVILYLLWKRTR